MRRPLSTRARTGQHEGEAYFSAEHPPTQKDARISDQDVLEEWPNRAQAAPRKGPQASDRRRRTVGGETCSPSLAAATATTRHRLTGEHHLKPTKGGGHAFSWASRVRRRLEFERAYADGVRVRGRYMTVFLVSNGKTSARLGIAATRKLGSAVERNRAKRLAREIFRRHVVASGTDVIIVPRREMLDASFNNIEADYLGIVDRKKPASRPMDRRPAGGGHSSRNPRL
jgi:ribonuclease P protein component